MIIADVSFERPDKKEGDKYRYVKIGALWFNKEEHRASLMLQAIRIGSFVARPRLQEEAPYLEGDMCVKTGTFTEGTKTKGRYMTVGYIQTKESSSGIVYFGQILCDPSPILVLGRIKDLLQAMITARDTKKMFDLEDYPLNSVFIPIFLSDRKQEAGAETSRKEEDPNDDNLPF